MIEKLKGLVDIAQSLKSFSFKDIFKIAIVCVFALTILNYKSIIRDCIELFTEIEKSIHEDKMVKRDELLAELGPILTDFRSNVRADRILYFEYHNSKENLVGIPFKYLELVKQNQSYGVQPAREDHYGSINSGAITNLYEDIKYGKLVYCSGPEDDNFHIKYSGVYNLFNIRDGAKRFAFISIPGINTPVGMIVLEWIENSPIEPDLEEISHSALHNYIPRINALILSKR